MGFTIITNNHPRELLALVQLPEADRADFDYVTGEDMYSARFVRYLGSWYDVNDCDGFALQSLAGWDTYASDSYFSGIVFRYPTEHYCGRTDYGPRGDDCHRCRTECDTVVVGRYYT